ncbi:hypothetical protein [Cryobacterium sp. PH29-G1]|uniref:hypothetical protein n=1 Tax=Cryobacterium sp. PH29-G1 TaxID=3046211 RepID=UPI0024BA7476|nr:hypothetical protein [Cryobacterium sp. PH29-G1]MDJ0348482.1 hypothetical protein [Cryobacterium sp. PH29-G1]
MDDPRANMEGNGLLGLGAPRVNWAKTPGRVPGFWLSVAGTILALPVPPAGFILAVISLMFSGKAFGVIPAKARGRGLNLTAIALAVVAILVSLVRVFA